MATYGYKAITKAGKEVKGSLEADNKDLAMAELRRQELTVIDLGEQSFLTKDIDIQIGGWPKARDLSVMCRGYRIRDHRGQDRPVCQTDLCVGYL